MSDKKSTHNIMRVLVKWQTVSNYFLTNTRGNGKHIYMEHAYNYSKLDHKEALQLQIHTYIHGWTIARTREHLISNILTEINPKLQLVTINYGLQMVDHVTMYGVDQIKRGRRDVMKI